MSGNRWTKLLAGADRLALEDGLELRLLSAGETLEARREAESLARDGRERALCANACLLARALEREGTPLFENGQAALDGLTAREIAALAEKWAAFDREENPSMQGEAEAETLKKAWSTRRTPGSAGACSGPSAPCPARRG